MGQPHWLLISKVSDSADEARSAGNASTEIPKIQTAATTEGDLAVGVYEDLSDRKRLSCA